MPTSSGSAVGVSLTGRENAASIVCAFEARLVSRKPCAIRFGSVTSVEVDGSIGRRLSATLSPFTVKYVPYAVSLRVNDGEKESACAGLPFDGSVKVGF